MEELKEIYRNRIKDIPYSYIAMDNIEYGTSKKLPLWQFGLMY